MQATLRLAATVLLFGALGAGWLGAASIAGSGASAGAAIVDRTWSCPLHTSDGFRVLGVSGAPGFVDLPTANAGMFVSDELAPSPQDQLLSVGSTAIRVSRGCAVAKPVPLTRRGLPGPPDIFQTAYNCESKPRRVLIRLKATAASSGPWTRQPPAHLELRRAVFRAEMSVQAPNGRPIGFVTIAGKQVRIWISPDCVRD